MVKANIKKIITIYLISNVDNCNSEARRVAPFIADPSSANSSMLPIHHFFVYEQNKEQIHFFVTHFCWS